MPDELDRFASDDLVRIHRDMAVIRAFENMLQEVKTTNKFHGIEYNHRGPAHLSIGQEASAVGQAYLLGVDDHIFGSHRSHGEILAKSLSAIEKLDDDTLMGIMKALHGTARSCKVVEKDADGRRQRPRRSTSCSTARWPRSSGARPGFNKGMGGSMHAFFTPFGVYPNNAIVGGSADISVGAALFKRVNRKPGIVICNIGDASRGLRPDLGSAVLRDHGPVQDPVGRGAPAAACR